MNRTQGIDGTPVEKHESLLYSPQSEIVVKHGKHCFTEVVDQVYLVADKCKERFSDGVQLSDFVSLGKTLILDSNFRKETWRIFSNLGHLAPVFWDLSNRDNKDIVIYAKDKFQLLIKK